jgi:hypothetical protein
VFYLQYKTIEKVRKPSDPTGQQTGSNVLKWYYEEKHEKSMKMVSVSAEIRTGDIQNKSKDH